MRVSGRADYALRAAIELAAASGSHVTGEQLARAPRARRAAAAGVDRAARFRADRP